MSFSAVKKNVVKSRLQIFMPVIIRYFVDCGLKKNPLFSQSASYYERCERISCQSWSSLGDFT